MPLGNELRCAGEVRGRSLQPVIFVLLLRYVFGGAISVPGGSYIDYLIPGIFVQTTLFGGNATAVGLAQDLHEGIIDRFRSLPMAHSAVLAGRTLADLLGRRESRCRGGRT